MRKLLALYKKHEEIVSYLFFGVLGVAVNLLAYSGLRVIGLDILLSNIVAWCVSVIFMFITNKTFVFKSKNGYAREFLLFLVARIATLVIESVILYLGIDIMAIPEIFVKLIAQVIVIVSNYLFSKLIVFKAKSSLKSSAEH